MGRSRGRRPGRAPDRWSGRWRQRYTPPDPLVTPRNGHRGRDFGGPVRTRRSSTAALRGGCPLATEVVLDPHDVVQLGRRDLDDLDPLDRLVSMPSADRDVLPFARAQVADGHRSVVALEMKPQPAADDEDRLVLALVVLEREAAAGLDDEDLPDVAVGVGPDQLVAPWLVDSACLGHEPRTSRSPASRSASRSSADVASVYTRTSGSVPLVRTSSHDPSSRKNFTPSFVDRGNLPATGWPPRDDG